MTRLSVLDRVPIPLGTTTGDAIRSSTEPDNRRFAESRALSYPPRGSLSRATALLTVFAVLGFGLAMSTGVAGAHVHADDSQQPPQGGYGVVSLIVPTESDAASTVGLTVTLPDGVDLTSARTLPIAGWTATVNTEPTGDGVRVSRIVWQATDQAQGIKPSEFGQFTFSAGPWPEAVNTVALRTEQAYSDGSVVAWNEVAVDESTEPEHPAPVVTLGASEGHHGDAHGAGPAASADATAGPPRDQWVWRITSLASLVIALGTAATLVAVLRRTRAGES